MDNLRGAVFRATGSLKMNGDISRAMEHGCVSWRSNGNVSANPLDGTGHRTICWSGQGHCLMDRWGEKEVRRYVPPLPIPSPWHTLSTVWLRCAT